MQFVKMLKELPFVLVKKDLPEMERKIVKLSLQPFNVQITYEPVQKLQDLDILWKFIV